MTWLVDHWQWITGTGSLLALLGLLWRGGLRLLAAQIRLSYCEERERHAKRQLAALRAEIEDYKDLVAGSEIASPPPPPKTRLRKRSKPPGKRFVSW